MENDYPLFIISTGTRTDYIHEACPVNGNNDHFGQLGGEVGIRGRGEPLRIDTTILS
jgi:hypothetical protein